MVTRRQLRDGGRQWQAVTRGDPTSGYWGRALMQLVRSRAPVLVGQGIMYEYLVLVEALSRPTWNHMLDNSRDSRDDNRPRPLAHSRHT